MQYKLYVPMTNDTQTKKNKKVYLEYLKKIKADTVFLSPTRESLFMGKKEQTEYFDNFSANANFYKRNGFEVGVWISTFGFGGALEERIAKIMQDQARITSVLGAKCNDAFCPEGELLVEFLVNYIQVIAKVVSPAMIMLDDEMCLSVRPGLGCFCEKHMALYEKEFQKAHTREELKDLIFTGYNEKYRKGWLKVVGDSMRKFCATLRRGLDEVCSSMRMGFCAGYTSWDVEGADAIELTKILAGKTKPFLRFSGAPYWVSSNIQRFRKQKLAEVIEFTRMQEEWCKGEDIEVFHECDAFPRPRYNVPCGPSECFDVALRASGNMGGMKYFFNYDMDAEYELGYVKKHIRNMPVYDFISANFDKKRAVGVQVIEAMHKIKDITLPSKLNGELGVMEKAFSPAAHFLTVQGIPTIYSKNSDSAIAFGDNALYIDELPKKLVLDIRAAEILQERGYDVGLKSRRLFISGGTEYYAPGKTVSYTIFSAKCYATELSSKAKVETHFETCNGERVATSYRYESEGREFLVFTFDAYEIERSNPLFTCYFRQRQLLDFFGVNYPYIERAPEVYTLCKDGKGERSVIFVNAHEDEETEFYVNLDKEYKSAEIYGAEGKFMGDKIFISSIVPAYSQFMIVLK